MDHDNHENEAMVKKRSCLESSLRCICIPCCVSVGVTRALCCPSHPPPDEWNVGFRLLMALMSGVTHNVVRSICCVRCFTDCTVPQGLPTLPNGLTIKNQKANHANHCPRPGEWVVPSTMRDDPRDKCPRQVILYFHGGAFALCKPSTHRGVTMRIVGESNKDTAIENHIGLFTVQYRRPPEHPFPEPIQDCVETYKWLLQHIMGGSGGGGEEGEEAAAASRIVLGGDSAGGALVVLTMAELKRQGIALPAGAIMISPWVDLADVSLNSWQENRNYDYLPPDLAQLFANSLVKGTEKTLEEISATNEDLSSFPPLYIVCGEKEVLRDQIIVFSEKAKDSGVDVNLVVEPGMVHAFVAFSDVVDAAIVDAWYSNMVKFIYKVLNDYNVIVVDENDENVVDQATCRPTASRGLLSGFCDRGSSYSLLDDSSKDS